MLLLGLASISFALPPGVSTATCRAGSAYQQVDWSPGGTSISCDYVSSGIYPDTGQGVVQIEASLGPVPEVDIQLSMRGTSSYSGSAGIRYYVSIEEQSSPPTATTSIPLLVRLKGEIQISNGGSASGQSFIGLGDNIGYYLINMSAASNDAPAERLLDYTTSIQLVPGEVYRISKHAVCSAWNNSSGSECFVLIDPELFFDQEGFDQLMEQAGHETFYLEDYYTIAYSANVICASTFPEVCGGKDESLSADNGINDSEEVSCKAEKSITLVSGFYVANGAAFSACITQ